MNKFKKALLAATLMACAASAVAAPAERARPAHHNNERPEMMGPPPAPPLYLIMQQTDSPNETLRNAVKNVPVLEKGKRYEIKLEVKELPLVPQPMPAPQQ